LLLGVARRGNGSAGSGQRKCLDECAAAHGVPLQSIYMRAFRRTNLPQPRAHLDERSVCIERSRAQPLQAGSAFPAPRRDKETPRRRRGTLCALDSSSVSDDLLSGSHRMRKRESGMQGQRRTNGDMEGKWSQLAALPRQAVRFRSASICRSRCSNSGSPWSGEVHA
jgi:hypothetical protein